MQFCLQLRISAIIFAVLIAQSSTSDVINQVSKVDSHYMRQLFHAFRNRMFRYIGKTGLRIRGYFLQDAIPDDVPFPCNVSLGKSAITPNSVHKLRPGDINVIAAIGDSTTAASGANSKRPRELYMENRGLAFNIGGQWNWRNVTTLPNILKEFNPKLVGYSLGDSYPFHKDTQFNVAEIGAASFDLPYLARALVKRIRLDSRVDFKHDWKMISILIGGNDICTFVCTMETPESLPAAYRLRLIRTLRYIRDSMPRTLVNVIPVPKVHTVLSLNHKPGICRTLNHWECTCWVGQLYNQTEASRKKWQNIQEQMSQVEQDVSQMEEFRGLDSFAVVFQPWTLNMTFIRQDGKVDYSLLAIDCLHLSQKGNAYAGVALWTNLLEPVGNKSTTWQSPAEGFKCPTKEAPYIFTNDNSQ